MGIYTDGAGIKCFRPDDTEDTLYFHSDLTIGEIIDFSKRYFGTDDVSNFIVTAEHIHTDCINYDLYDVSDYTNYIRITKA